MRLSLWLVRSAVAAAANLWHVPVSKPVIAVTLDRFVAETPARRREPTKVVETYPPAPETIREEAMYPAYLLQMIGLAVVLAVTAARAQENVRIRGTIERVDGSMYAVKTRDGSELKLSLADKPQIAGVTKASLSDIREGSFVGVTAMPQADGGQRALEVHIFPEAMRGTGEGDYPWDLKPRSTMTNANVEQVVAAVDGRTLTLKYKGAEKKIFVPADAPIVSYVPGEVSDLKPGAKVFVVAAKQPDGTLQGRAWRVGRNGVTPPM
jgi:hypothetical protein